MNYLSIMYMLGIVAILVGFIWALYMTECQVRARIVQMDREQEKYIKQRDLDRHSEKKKKE